MEACRTVPDSDTQLLDAGAPLQGTDAALSWCNIPLSAVLNNSANSGSSSSSRYSVGSLLGAVDSINASFSLGEFFNRGKQQDLSAGVEGSVKTQGYLGLLLGGGGLLLLAAGLCLWRLHRRRAMAVAVAPQPSRG